MTKSDGPFSIAGLEGPRLERVLAHWRELRRGNADIPFWDDLDLPAFRALCGDVFLLDVFEKPQRFRLSLVEAGLSAENEAKVLGRFIDEVDLPPPFGYLRSQCSATIESAAPTLYVRAAKTADDKGYARLLLPAWGEGQIHMLMGAIDWR